MSGDHGYDPFGFGPPNPAMEAEVAEIDEPQAELARLRAECEELRGSVKSKQNCLDAALEGWNKANARIERLRLTLRPFARVGEAIAEWEPDDKDLWLGIVHCIPDSARILPVAWFRNAAATLKDEP